DPGPDRAAALTERAGGTGRGGIVVHPNVRLRGTTGRGAHVSALVGETGPARLAVRARDVRKRFGRNEVLQGVDLDVPKGEVLVLIGPSGSGKTTLLRCVNHLVKIDGGTIEVNGHFIGYRRGKNGALVEDEEKSVARQ